MKKGIIAVLLAGFLISGRAHPSAHTVNHDADQKQVEGIFAIHDVVFADPSEASLEAYLSAVADDVILMPHDARVMEGKEAYRKHLRDISTGGHMDIKHELIEVYSYPEIVIVRGRAAGSFTANGQGLSHSFETKNIFIFRRLTSGGLKVWQIIFNHNPARPANPPASPK